MIDGVPPGSLPEPLVEALQAQGFEALTDIQRAVLDPETAGSDMRLSSETGSGKTVALGMAIIRDLAETTASKKGPRACVMAPTRELAQQVARELKWLFAAMQMRVAVVTGGAPYGPEVHALSRKPDVLVATPGRLADHLQRGNVSHEDVAVLVLDEADQLLEQGFREELDAIRASMGDAIRVHLVSATFRGEVLRMAQRFQSNASSVQGTALGAANPRIAHTVHLVRQGDRFDALVNILLQDPDLPTIIFVRTRVQTADLSDKLQEAGFAVASLNGDLSQPERERRLAAFRRGAVKVLVATDVAARGLDVPSVGRVVHGEPPEDGDAYTHRSGRTGRAGRDGQSILMALPRDRFRVERSLQQARVEARWEPTPGAKQIRKKAQKRFVKLLRKEAGKGLAAQSAPEMQASEAQVSEAQVSEAQASEAQASEAQGDGVQLAATVAPTGTAPAAHHMTLAEKLLAEHAPADLVARLLSRVGYEGPCAPRTLQPMELPKPRERGPALKERRGAAEHGSLRRAHRAGRETSEGRAPLGRRSGVQFVPMQLSWGATQGADARRVVGLVCRRGLVNSDRIGAIRVGPRSTTFELDARAVNGLLDAFKRPDRREPGVRVRRFPGAAGRS